MIKRLFIANRGEIARRIVISAQKLGVETVCLATRKDPPQYLAANGSQFYWLKEETKELYLNPERLIAIALESKCDSVHPGFGFLSENAVFARLVKKAKLIWLGPDAKTIEKMADKALAGELAKKAGLELIPQLKDFHHENLDNKTLKRLKDFGEQNKWSLLVKATLGGGGKGMRQVTCEEELEPAIARASSEALKAFGSGQLLLERYIPEARHLEVQLLADGEGSVITLGDRDCSLQRRHQKIFEEAPAPFLPESLRKKIALQAKTLAEAVAYKSAGTVEFLLVWDEAAKKDPTKAAVYFLEMNTRLQVEHPVSEEITGIDLVEWQIRIASGEKIPAHMQPKKFHGHALEARLYAEDCFQNFLPSPGGPTVFYPKEGKNIRWELGLDRLDQISAQFDPMIAKVITWGKTRQEALSLLVKTLAETAFFGVENNREWLVHILQDEQISKQAYTTNCCLQMNKKILLELAKKKEKKEAEAKKTLLQIKKSMSGLFTKQALLSEQPEVAALSQESFMRRQKNLPLKPTEFSTEEKEEAQMLWTEKSLWFSKKAKDLSCWHLKGLDLEKSLQAPIYCFYLSRSQDKILYLHLDGYSFAKSLTNVDTRASQETKQTVLDDIRSPVPGKVVSITIKAGEDVLADQVLFVIESMKIELEIKAGMKGKIGKVCVSQGEQIPSGELLASYLSYTSPV